MNPSVDAGKQNQQTFEAASHTGYQLISSPSNVNLSDSKQMKSSLSVPFLQLEEVKVPFSPQLVIIYPRCIWQYP